MGVKIITITGNGKREKYQLSRIETDYYIDVYTVCHNGCYRPLTMHVYYTRKDVFSCFHFFQTRFNQCFLRSATIDQYDAQDVC